MGEGTLGSRGEGVDGLTTKPAENSRIRKFHAIIMLMITALYIIDVICQIAHGKLLDCVG